MPGSPPTLEQTYRRFGAAAAGTSPLQQRVAVALAESDAALRAVAAAPARGRAPAAVLAALHDLALAGGAPALAAAYATGDGDAAAGAAVNALLRSTEEVVHLVARRPVRTDDAGGCAVLLPAVAEVARRVAADAVGLVDVGCPTGFDLLVDRVGVRYGDGGPVGDPSSPVQLATSVVHRRPVPTRPVPEVVARVVVDPDPLDLTDADDVRWLRACLPPDRPELAARLEGALALAAASPPLLLRADPVEALRDAVARVPADALPVVVTAWALARRSPEDRLRLLHRLDAAAVDRTVTFVAVEGVGVAPAVPTLGDRRASGHSTIGLVVADRTALHAEALGRCWSRGRTMSWFGEA